MNLKCLNINELDSRMKTLVQKERDLLHEVLLTIKEIDSRRTYLELGFPNMFEYLVNGIGYSEGSAQRRIDAARLLKELPELAEKIQSGELKLSQISLVQKAAREVFKTQSLKVSAADKSEIIEQLINKNHYDSQKEIASFFDLPAKQESFQKVQADESVRLEITLTKDQFAKLQHAQNLLSHALPAHDLALFVEYVSDKIIKQKTIVKSNTATVAVKTLSDKTKKQVLARQSCCQYKNPLNGKVCQSMRFLQVDHIIPRWAGGSNHINNLQVLCAQHNNLKYRKEVGVKLSS